MCERERYIRPWIEHNEKSDLSYTPRLYKGKERVKYLKTVSKVIIHQVFKSGLKCNILRNARNTTKML